MGATQAMAPKLYSRTRSRLWCTTRPYGWQIRKNQTSHQKPTWGRDNASVHHKQPFECYTCENQSPSSYIAHNEHCQATDHGAPGLQHEDDFSASC